MAVFLCGFMGCGKSTVGRRLAEKLGRKFIDMDKYIEKELHMTIPEIFAEKGEAFFRSTETDTVVKLSETKNIVACGGGVMLNKKNADEARKNGIIVYIAAPFEDCYGRISGDRNRPIVMANTKESLEDIYNKRVPLYEENSDVKVDGSGTPMEIAERIAEAVCMMNEK
ncbi:MAG: shikimate kinase [Oscillospiraceae bacterium]|nr:shikimate kinase [Oscillospiraceae bacterium]MBQ4311932.1 shikimate kinase [Oscillospiraceae bacterium]